jgi:hypothetical protein
MRASFSGRVGVSVISSIVIAVALVLMLTYLKAQDSLANMVESRNAFVAGTLKNRLELGLGLGLELESLNNIQDIINAAAAADPNIEAIQVFQTQGQVLFGAGPQGHNNLVPASWSRLLTQGRPDEAWSIRDSGALVTGVALTNSFEQIVGGLAISYSRQSFDATSRAMLGDIIVGCGKIMAIALLLAVASVLLVARSIGRSFQRAVSSLNRFRDEANSTASEPLAKAGLELAVARFEDRMQAAHARIGRAEQQLDKLDA